MAFTNLALARDNLISDEGPRTQAINDNPGTIRNHVFLGRYPKALLARLDRNRDVVFTHLDSEDLIEEPFRPVGLLSVGVCVLGLGMPGAGSCHPVMVNTTLFCSSQSNLPPRWCRPRKC